MAKGNIGNLLQHFVGLNCIERLVRDWEYTNSYKESPEPIDYIDCYSMAPWEPVEGRNPQGFVQQINTFPQKAAGGDMVACTFIKAWNQQYGVGANVPGSPRDRDYPNTAVLLKTAFPDQAWNMRLHDIDPMKRAQLSAWARAQAPGTYEVEGAWRESGLIRRRPASSDHPVVVMLDPYQLVQDDHAKDGETGYLSEQELVFLLGRHMLDLLPRQSGKDAPGLILLFSYADSDPDQTDNLVRSVLSNTEWHVEQVRAGPYRVHTNSTFHQGWVASCGLPTPLVAPSLQGAWDSWLM